MANTDLTIKYKVGDNETSLGNTKIVPDSDLVNNLYAKQNKVNVTNLKNGSVRKVNFDSDININQKNSFNITTRTTNFFLDNDKRNSEEALLKKEQEELKKYRIDKQVSLEDPLFIGFNNNLLYEDDEEIALQESIDKRDRALKSGYHFDPDTNIATINFNGDMVYVDVDERTVSNGAEINSGTIKGTKQKVTYELHELPDGTSSVNLHLHPANSTEDPFDSLYKATLENNSKSIKENYYKYGRGQNVSSKKQSTESYIDKYQVGLINRNSNLLEITNGITGYKGLDHATGNLFVINKQQGNETVQDVVVGNTYIPSKMVLNSGIELSKEKSGNVTKDVNASIVAFNNTPTDIKDAKGNKLKLQEVANLRASKGEALMSLDTTLDHLYLNNGISLSSIELTYRQRPDRNKYTDENFSKPKMFGTLSGSSETIGNRFLSFIDNIGHTMLSIPEYDEESKSYKESNSTYYGDDRLFNIAQQSLPFSLNVLEKAMVVHPAVSTVDGLNIVSLASIMINEFDQCLKKTTDSNELDICSAEHFKSLNDWSNLIKKTGVLPFGQVSSNGRHVFNNNRTTYFGQVTGQEFDKKNKAILNGAIDFASSFIRHHYGVSFFNQTAVNTGKVFTDVARAKNPYDLVDQLTEVFGDAKYANDIAYNLNLKPEVIGIDHSTYYKLGVDSETGKVISVESKDGKTFSKYTEDIYTVKNIINNYVENLGGQLFDQKDIDQTVSAVQKAVESFSDSQYDQIVKSVSANDLDNIEKQSHVMLSLQCQYHVNNYNKLPDSKLKDTSLIKQYAESCINKLYRTEDKGLSKSNFIASRVTDGIVGTLPKSQEAGKYDSEYETEINKTRDLLKDPKVVENIKNLLQTNNLTPTDDLVKKFTGYLIISNKDRKANEVLYDFKDRKKALSKTEYIDSTGHKINIIDDFKYTIAETDKFRDKADAMSKLDKSTLQQTVVNVYDKYVKELMLTKIQGYRLNEIAKDKTRSEEERNEALSQLFYLQKKSEDLLNNSSGHLINYAASAMLSQSSTEQGIEKSVTVFDIGESARNQSYGYGRDDLKKGYALRSHTNPTDNAKRFNSQEVADKFVLYLTTQEGFSNFKASLMRDQDIKYRNQKYNNYKYFDEENKQENVTEPQETSGLNLNRIMSVSTQMNSNNNKVKKLLVA